MTEGEMQQAYVSKGVDQLIARLRDEGVNKGEQEAELLVNEAKLNAKKIIQEASEEAQRIKETARKQSEDFKAAGESAIKTAMRDMVLQLKLDLTQDFSEDLKRLVSHQLQQPEILRQMIIELVGRSAKSIKTSEQKNIEIVLPQRVIGLEELRNNPDAIASGKLMEFVFGLTRDMLQQGVEFSVSETEDLQSGLRVKLTDQNLELDLSEKAVADILLQHLQPRFRAILEGVVR